MNCLCLIFSFISLLWINSSFAGYRPLIEFSSIDTLPESVRKDTKEEDRLMLKFRFKERLYLKSEIRKLFSDLEQFSQDHPKSYVGLALLAEARQAMRRMFVGLSSEQERDIRWTKQDIQAALELNPNYYRPLALYQFVAVCEPELGEKDLCFQVETRLNKIFPGNYASNSLKMIREIRDRDRYPVDEFKKNLKQLYQSQGRFWGRAVRGVIEKYLNKFDLSHEQDDELVKIAMEAFLKYVRSRPIFFFDKAFVLKITDHLSDPELKLKYQLQYFDDAIKRASGFEKAYMEVERLYRRQEFLECSRKAEDVFNQYPKKKMHLGLMDITYLCLIRIGKPNNPLLSQVLRNAFKLIETHYRDRSNLFFDTDGWDMFRSDWFIHPTLTLELRDHLPKFDDKLLNKGIRCAFSLSAYTALPSKEKTTVVEDCFKVWDQALKANHKIVSHGLTYHLSVASRLSESILTPKFLYKHYRNGITDPSSANWVVAFSGLWGKKNIAELEKKLLEYAEINPKNKNLVNCLLFLKYFNLKNKRKQEEYYSKFEFPDIDDPARRETDSCIPYMQHYAHTTDKEFLSVDELKKRMKFQTGLSVTVLKEAHHRGGNKLSKKVFYEIEDKVDEDLRYRMDNDETAWLTNFHFENLRKTERERLYKKWMSLSYSAINIRVNYALFRVREYDDCKSGEKAAKEAAAMIPQSRKGNDHLSDNVKRYVSKLLVLVAYCNYNLGFKDVDYLEKKRGKFLFKNGMPQEKKDKKEKLKPIKPEMT